MCVVFGVRDEWLKEYVVSLLDWMIDFVWLLFVVFVGL